MSSVMGASGRGLHLQGGAVGVSCCCGGRWNHGRTVKRSDRWL